jgi:hypothetical protein
MAKTFTHCTSTSFISPKKNLKEDFPPELPKMEVIKNILNFSKALKVHKSHLAGNISFVLN